MLTREQVISVYTQVLERAPREDEIQSQLANMPDLDSLLRVALGSEEYAERLKQQGLRAVLSPTVVNIFHPDLAAWTIQPGTRSADGVAIVGREGWLFLCGGTNANLAQYVGEVQMPPNWLKDWRKVIQRRESEANQMGVSLALLVVPDKLAVYEEHYPEELQRSGPRPIERLLSDGDLPIFYPLTELRRAADAGDDTYMPTDTHLTFRGNEILSTTVLEALGVERPPDFSDLPLRTYPVKGDLGAKFDPPIVGIVSEPGSLGHARIVEDNRAEIAAVEGNIGTRRVFRNEQAPDQRVAVVFGDSFGFAGPDNPGLSWFLAQIFRELHFIWVPFGWDPDYVRRVGAEAVLAQGAERFVGRVPRLKVNVSGLAEETLRRKRPLDIESVSG